MLHVLAGSPSTRSYSGSSLLLPAGNGTIIGKLLFGTAYIRTPFFGGAVSSVEDVTRLFSQSQLTTQEKTDALAQAIVLGLQQREPETVATLVGITLSTSDANTVKDGFAEVRLKPHHIAVQLVSLQTHILPHIFRPKGLP